MADHRIVVFGDVIDDVVAIPSGPIRRDTDTPSSIRFTAGGSAANTACWLGSVGADVVFVGLVGSADVERHSQLFRSSGVEPKLDGHPDLPTGTIVIVVEGQTRAMLTDRGANVSLDPDSVTDELLSTARVLYVTGHALISVDDPSPFTRLMERARALGLDVAISPGSAGFIADYGTERFLSAVAAASILIPSLEEGRLLSGLDEPAAVAAALAARFGRVILTLGVEGVLVAERAETPVFISPVVADALDPTGAGDAFAAGFLHEWVASEDAERAAAAGARLAAQAVSVIGARPPADFG